MVPSREYAEGAVRIKVAEPGGSSRTLRQTLATSSAHGFGAVEDKNAAAAHGLERRGALNGANLADAQHGAGDGSFEAHGIGNERPDVGMRLQDQWSALDGGGVGAFAALGDALLDELLRIGEERDALTGVALTAEIVGEALAVGSLREHARERVFADSARAGKEQGVRDAAAAESAL